MRLENQTDIKNDATTSFRIPHAPATMRQNTDGTREPAQWRIEDGFQSLLTNEACPTVADGFQRREWPDCACSRVEIRCIEFHQAVLSAFA
jgi:hypothetical protein